MARYAGPSALARAVEERQPAAVLLASGGTETVPAELTSTPELHGLPIYRLAVEMEQLALPLHPDGATVHGERSTEPRSGRTGGSEAADPSPPEVLTSH